MDAETFSCSNGLTALLKQEGELPLISLQFWVQRGSIHEGAQLGAGLSHLLEHMVFKGTKSYSGQELAQRVQALGGIWNAYTSSDRTVYHIDGPAQHWREFLSILNELVFHPSFPKEEWDKEREVIRREMAMYQDDPDDFAYKALNETLFTAHPRREPVIGHRARFDALSYEDMVQYHADNYVPEQVFICCCAGAGCIEPTAFQQAVEACTSELSAKAAPVVALAKEAPQWGPRHCQREFAQATSKLMLAWRVPAADHPDAAPLALLASIMGDGRAAWLHSRFHDELGLAHDISATVIPARAGEGEGAFLIEADCETDQRDQVQEELLSYLCELPDSEAFEQGRQRALRLLRVQRLKSLASVQGAANMLGISWHLSRNLNYLEEWEQALLATSAADIQRVAQQYMQERQRCTIIIDPIVSNKQEEAPLATQESPLMEHQLSCGLRLILRPSTTIPMLHATMAFGAGCGSENAVNSGIGSLMGECMLKGSSTRSAADIATGLENLGASIEAESGNNTLCVNAQCLSEDAADMLAILADVIINPSFPEKSIINERDAMLADRLDAMEDPCELAFFMLRNDAFGPNSYGLSPEGSPTSIPSLTREQVVAHHQRICCASNAVLSLVGDFEPASLIAQLEELFASMPSGEAIQRQKTWAQRAPNLGYSLDKEQSVLTIALHSPAVQDPDLLKLTLLLEWCRDMAGPIFTEIREERGLAYYASATSFSGVDAGAIIFYLGTAPEQLWEARAALESCLDRIAKEGITPDELERTRATALAGHMMNSQSHKRISAGLAVDSLLGLESDYLFRAPERLAAITHEEMQDFIKALLAPEQTRSLCWVSPSELTD